MNKKILLLLGISMVTQATTSLIGGLVGIGPFTETKNIAAAMNSIADSLGSVYAGIFLQIVTALVIIILGTALYQASCHINKTVSIIAMSFYITEAIMHIISQISVFAIAEVSSQFVNNGDTTLLSAAQLLFALREFTGAITMIPFGLGAWLFYYLIMKAKIIPKWLGLWGLITLPLILVGWTLEAFSIVPVPFIIYIPYVPWEWVAGVYIIIKSLKNANSQGILSQSAVV